jgi:hypothetical protein
MGIDARGRHYPAQLMVPYARGIFRCALCADAATSANSDRSFDILSAALPSDQLLQLRPTSELKTERFRLFVSLRVPVQRVGDGGRGPFAFCDATSCPLNARATTGFRLSTIDVGIRIVAPRSLVVS